MITEKKLSNEHIFIKVGTYFFRSVKLFINNIIISDYAISDSVSNVCDNACRSSMAASDPRF